MSSGARIETLVCLTASSFCALPRWLILTLVKETMTTCWKCCQTWIKTWKSYWKRWKKSQVGCFPRQGTFTLLSKNSNPSYTSKLKSSAFSTRSSLTTFQLLHHITTVPQDFTLTTEYCLDSFSDYFMCVCILFLQMGCYLFEGRNSDFFFCNWAHSTIYPSSNTQQMTNDVNITPVNKVGTYFLWII